MKNTKTAVAASDFRFEAGSERVVAGNGELNANNNADLLVQQQRLMAATSAGHVDTDENVALTAKRKQERKELVRAAFDDPAVHRVIGERMAEELYVTSNRKGFARRFLAKNPLEQGEIPRFKISMKNVQAFTATGPTRTETQLVSDRWLTPPEFQIHTRPFIAENELNQSTSDILNEKYIEGLEGVMVQEDRTWYNLAKKTIGLANEQSIIAGQLNPTLLMNVSMNVQRWGLKPVHLLMAADLIVDIIGDSTFITAIEPVARHELVMTGQMGILYGMTIISEQFRHPEHKVLDSGEYIVVSDPQMHGAYSDRGGINSEPINASTENVIGRGWLMYESISMAVANDRSVAFGRRV